MEPMDDREELLVMNIIILFCLIEGVGYTSNGSESSPVVLLGEDGPCCELRCVYF